MASRVSKNPKVVNQTGHRLAKLPTTVSCLGVVKSHVFTDSSSASAGARSHGAAVVTYKGTPICYNMSAMQLLNGSSGSWKTRHLRLRSSWFKEQVSAGQMRTPRAGKNAAGRPGH